MIDSEYIQTCIDLEANITPNFKWKEFLLLNNWGWYAFPDKQQIMNLTKVAKKLEEIRLIFNSRPIYVLSGLRPIQYNKAINGAENSAHIFGMAVDFHVENIISRDVRNALFNHLESLQIRTEKLQDHHQWVHIDIRSPIDGNRYFSP